MPTWDCAVTLRSTQAQGQGSSKDRDAQMNGSADMIAHGLIGLLQAPF